MVFTGGGAELVGLADFAQSALGKPVRIGRPPALRGLPEAHAKPGFATLVGLVLFATGEQADIRTVTRTLGPIDSSGWLGLFRRIRRAVLEYF
ncbi:MAG TPA: hypothetical protein VI199_11070 [Novosphingobium sp.]